LAKKNNLTWPKCKTQLNKKHLCDPLFGGWWANPGHHGFNPGESSQKSTRIEICKKISTQPNPNPWWAKLARGFQPILIALYVKTNDGTSKGQNRGKCTSMEGTQLEKEILRNSSVSLSLTLSRN